MNQPLTSPGTAIHDIWLSVALFPAISIVERLGIVHYLQSKSATAEEIAEQFGLQLQEVETLVGVMTATKPPLFTRRNGELLLTDLARVFLLPQSPYYYGAVLKVFWDTPTNGASFWKKMRWQEGRQPLSGEQPESEIAVPWEHEQPEGEQTRRWTEYLHGLSAAEAYALACQDAWFSGVRRLLDVGGGSGCFSLALAEHFPSLECTVMDLPEVCPITQSYIARSTAASRVTTCGTDMFNQPWPSGYDAVFFANVFHDWTPEQCQFLAERSYQILPPGGRLYLYEMLWNDTKDGPLETALFSFYLVHFTENGRQYSGPELRTILQRAGFQEISIYNAPGYHSLICSRK